MKQNSLTDFINEVIVELQQEGRFATAYIYKYALRAFTQSVGGGEIFWGGLNRGALRRFQTYLEDLQKSYNTISTYIRALRAVYNRAVDRGLVAGEFRLFANLKTGVASGTTFTQSSVPVFWRWQVNSSPFKSFLCKCARSV